MFILNISKVELNWFLVSEYDPNCEMETNCGDDGEEEEEEEDGSPLVYDDEGEGEDEDDVVIGEVNNPLLNGHESVEEKGTFEWRLTAVPSNQQKIKVGDK